MKDVTVVNMEPGPAAQAFIAGQNDVAMTYEPYLSAVRDKPEAGKIIATTLDYPMVMDTFGCTPKFIAENDAAVKALTKSYFDALEMIKTDQAKAYEIMGADVKQTGEAVRQVGRSICAGRTRPRTRSSSPASIAAFSQGGRRPAAGDRHHQADPGPVEARRSEVRAVSVLTLSRLRRERGAPSAAQRERGDLERRGLCAPAHRHPRSARGASDAATAQSARMHAA